MGDTFRHGAGPAPEVAAYLDGRKLAPSFDWRDIYGEEHAYAFTVAKATQIDVLTAIHTEVEKAIKEGLPLAAFKKNLAPTLKKLGWWGKSEEVDPATGFKKEVLLGSNRRLKTIYWANTRTAYGAGKWARAQRTKAALPYLVYRLGASAEHRPHHVSKENTILPIDHPFWNEWYPPNGWGCNCWVRQISEAEAASLGGVTDAPEVAAKDWLNERSGEVIKIPEGIDPGWQTNPGKARHRTLAQHLSGAIDNAPEHIRKAAMTDLLSSQLFRNVQSGKFADKKIFAPAAIVPQHVAEAMNAHTRVAFLSTSDAAKQIRKRPELTPLDYIQAQYLLDHGTIIKESATDFGAHGLIDGQLMRAVFHTTDKGDEIFLKSFRKTNPKQIERYSKRGENLAP